MIQLEDIAPGTRLNGLAGSNPAEIIASTWRGDSALEVVYKDSSGNLREQILYRDSQDSLSPADTSEQWSFTADGNTFRLMLEAFRMRLAYVFDPYLAVHNSAIEPLPHQISAVYQEMLPRYPLRYVIADDPGAGKTIMAGLFIKELFMRGDLKRCLIVSPGSLAEQWQDELERKFDLSFGILPNDAAESTRNIFTDMNLCIARLDKLARNDALKRKLEASSAAWDLVVVDEAHKMSATIYGKDINYTKRFQLGRLLSKTTRHFLLLTATPHNGKNDDFQLFMSLVDSDRYEGATHSGGSSIDVSGNMRRLVKEELLRFDGTPLFPERRAFTVSYTLSPCEAQLYNEVTEYIRNEFNRADKLSTKRKNNVGFALTILQRRLASSPEAIYQSLQRRIERLEERLTEEKSNGTHNEDYSVDDYDPDEITASELERREDTIASGASASTTIRELEAEIDTLKRLAVMAGNVRDSGEDRKWRELSSIIQDDIHMTASNGQREKLIIFTEHKDTLTYLAGKIRTLMGKREAVITIHGGMQRDERRKAESLFMNDDRALIMVATDAAGEGINLQRAHLMVNYDLPWNPNRLEQRFGRIHRIGQKEVCHLWNLVAKDTREGAVFQRLFQKLENEREALGGKVFDILGKLTFDNAPLRDLLIKAIRYGNDPAVRNKLNEAVDNSLERERLLALLKQRALAEDVINISTITQIRGDIERAETRKLQPYFLEAFFIEAFKNLGGKIFPREKGRHEITFLPPALRNIDRVLSQYERVCFSREAREFPGKPPAELIAPKHPLFEAVIDKLRDKYSGVLTQGAILIDESDSGIQPRLLFAVEDSIQDGTNRIISKRIHFVEIHTDGKTSSAGYAPHLEHRPATTQEQSAILDHLEGHELLSGGIEEKARHYAIESAVPEHLAQVKARKLATLEKTQRAVKDRLTREINYWDAQAIDLKEKEAAGKSDPKLSAKNATARADELEARMKARLAEIETEKHISPLPPAIISAALIIPQGLLQIIKGKSELNTSNDGDKKKIEILAMNAVMQAEIQQGHHPRDVSAQKCGYDIESVIPSDEGRESLRFIEVKGRAKGAKTVTVSANEVSASFNNKDSFILALVEIDGGAVSNLVYLRNPFISLLDFTMTSANYEIKKLIQRSEIVYEK